MKNIYILLLITFSVCAQKKKDKETTKEIIGLEKLHKIVKYRENKTYHNMNIYNGACNYKILINDMPVLSMYDNARGEINVPINGKILKSGKQSLKIILFPFYDENRKLKKELNQYAGLDITITEIEWNDQERKFDTNTVLDYKTPREGTKSLVEKPSVLLIEDDEKTDTYEEEIMFDIEVPYNLKGWTKSVNLKNENIEELTKEVVKYYESLAKDFESKNLKNIAKKYYNKEKEVAQSFFHDKKEADTRWNIDILERIIDSSASVRKIEKYKIKFFGGGNVVALMRFPGKSPLCVVTKKQNGGSKHSVFDVFLHRPKPGAPLQMIR